MKNYIYNANIGTFEIRQKSHLLYQLWLGEELENELENVPTGIAQWTMNDEDTPQK